MSGKFNVLNLLNDSSKGEKDPFEVKMIDIYDIEDSEDNFYSTEEINELADSIEMFGVMQNAIVKRKAGDDKTFIQIAGHRRKKACIKLVEEGKEKFRYLPCVVEGTGDSIREKLLLICTNSTTRQLSDFEKVEQMNQLKQLLVEYKKEHDIPGRMRDLVADTLHISTTQVARMESISNNLSEELKEEFKSEKISISAAYELSGLEKEKQAEIYEKAKEQESSSATFNISLKEIKDMKQAEKEQEEIEEAEQTASESKLTLDDLELSVTADNALHKNGIDSIDKLCAWSEKELIDLKIGDFYVKKIIKKLEEHGKYLRPDNLETESEDNLESVLPEDDKQEEVVEDTLEMEEPAEKPKAMLTAKKHLLNCIQLEENILKEMKDQWTEKNPDALLKHETMLLAYKSYLKELQKNEDIINSVN